MQLKCRHTLKKNRIKSVFTFSLRNSNNSMEKASLHSSVKFCAVVQELSFLALILPGYCKYYAMFLPLILKILHNYPCLRGMNKNHYPGDCLRFNHWARMRCCQATCVFWQKYTLFYLPAESFWIVSQQSFYPEARWIICSTTSFFFVSGRCCFTASQPGKKKNSLMVFWVIFWCDQNKW